MAWDPIVLRKYGTTSHFRLLNQVRSELNVQPIARHPGGEINLGLTRRGTTQRIPVEVRGTTASQKPNRSAQPAGGTPGEAQTADSASFRDRLRAIDMR
jgi:hypothetical protein